MYKSSLSTNLLAGWSKIRAVARVIFQKPEWLFTVIAIVFGLTMVFSMPLFAVPDESSHFLRAFQVSQGTILGQTVNDKTGGYLPNKLDVCTKVASNCINEELNLSKTKFIGFSASAYSPVVYIPQAVGIAITKTIYPSVGAMAIVGRIFNLVAYIAMFFWAIRFAKFGKWVYVVIGLFPVAIQQAASLSGDVMTIGLCVLWISLLGNIYVRTRIINSKQILYMSLLSVGLILTKQTNALLLIGLLFIPAANFKNIWHKFRAIGLVAICAIIAGLAWYILLSGIHYNYNYPLPSEVLINQSAQLKVVLHNPGVFAIALIHEYIFEGFHSIGGVSPDFLIVSMHSFFSSFSYKLPLLFCITGYIGLIMALLYKDKSDATLNINALKRLSIANAFIFVLSLVAIAGALYLTWSPVGSMFIYGVQGRYFLPIIPLLIPIFFLIKRYISFNANGKYTIGVTLGSISTINLLLMVILTIRFFHA